MKDEYVISKEDAEKLYGVFSDFLAHYKEKPAEESDAVWLQKQFGREFPGLSEKERKETAGEVVTAIQVFDNNYRSVNEAVEKGVSKEKWFEEKVKESAVGLSQLQYGDYLENVNDFLYKNNLALEERLTVPKYDNRPIVERDGVARGVNMNKNLDGNLAEEMIARTAQIDAMMQEKNVSVDVLESYSANSVDVRIKNNATGEYQNYQLKYGKDAKATIQMIEEGNYNNQRIIVPKEQVKEVQEYFKSKGSNKTITDHIEAYGVKGKSYTKAELKKLQKEIQEQGKLPELGYNEMRTSTILKSISTNAGALALQSAAITTGWEVIHDLATGKKIDGDELVENAIKTGADTGVKVIAAGALEVGVRKGILKFIPKGTPAGIIANIACVGVENVKILSEVGEGKISVTQGLDKMGRTTVSMSAGLVAAGEGAVLGATLGSAIPIPVVGTVVGGLIGGMVGYAGGSKVGEFAYKAAKKVANVAKTAAKVAVNGAKTVYNAVKGVAKVAVTVGKKFANFIKKGLGLEA